MEQSLISAIHSTQYLALSILLFFACWEDVKNRRIPNKLVALGVFAGVATHILSSNGITHFSFASEKQGFFYALSGFTVGLAILMPLYILRAMGAGDVKLMGMIGAFLGPVLILETALITLLVGGVISILVATWNKSLASLLHTVYRIFSAYLIDATSKTIPTIISIENTQCRLPYAIPITTGTAIAIALHLNGLSLIS